MSVLQLVFIIFSQLLAVFILRWLTQKPKRKLNLPPSPAKLPVIGNFHQLGNYPHRSLQSLSHKHGPLFLLHLGQTPVLVVSSPDAAREIMKTHDQVFSNRPKTTMPDKLLYGSKDIAFSPYGEYWRQVKSISVLNLLSNKRVQSYKIVREEVISTMVEKITDASTNNQLINITDILNSVTNDVVCKVALGFKFGETEKGSRLKKLLGELGEYLGVFCIGDYVPWLWWVDWVNGVLGKAEKIAKDIDEILQATIDEHIEKEEKKKHEGGGKNFVEILLEIQRENKLGFPISADTLKALLLDMFAAGTETIYTLMEWIIAELLRQPDVMIKLQNEVRQIVGNKPNVSEEDLEKMSYLKLVIKETLRLHPSVPLLVPRVSTHDVKIFGYDVEAGTQVIVNAWAIGRDPSVWEDPDEFKPDRFLDNPADFKGLNFGFIPFGVGRRGCPGIQFALVVTELVLATLLYKFDIALPDGEKAEDVDMSETIGINCHKKSPILISVTPNH